MTAEWHGVCQHNASKREPRQIGKQIESLSLPAVERRPKLKFSKQEMHNYLLLGFCQTLRFLRVKIIQFSSVSQSCLTLCEPMNCSTPGLPVHHELPEFTQTHVHWDSDAIQPSHPLLSPSPPALNLFWHQGLFQWIGSLPQVAQVLEFQLQHQSLQWIFRVGFL